VDELTDMMRGFFLHHKACNQLGVLFDEAASQLENWTLSAFMLSPIVV